MKATRGFTLIEILAYVAILALIAYATIPGTIQRRLDEKIKAEDETLEAVRRDIVHSFEHSDPGNIASDNIAVFAADTPSLTPTAFTTNPDATFSTSPAQSWFCKVARMRGATFSTTAAPTRPGQPQLASILFNDFGRARLLIPGPTESDKQRFVLISVMARGDHLTFPPYQAADATNWFENVWNTEWNSRTAALPTYFANLLTSGQAAAWAVSSGNGSPLYRVRVVKFTLDKCPLNISNSHPTDNLYVTWGDLSLTGTGAQAPLVALANSGAYAPTPMVFVGRSVTIYKGTSIATATKAAPITVRSATDIVCQSSP